MRVSPRTVIILHDLVMSAIAWELGWLARFNLSLQSFEYSWPINLQTLPIIVAVQGVIAWRFGLYRGVWRFASLPDLLNIIRAAGLGALAITLVLFIVNRLEGVPRSLLILYPLFLIFVLGSPRLVYRLWKDHSLNLRAISGRQRVLIIGAGRAGETVVRDLLREGSLVPVGHLDDRKELAHRRIHGIPVLGSIAALQDIVKEHEVDMIFIAIPSATNAQMQRIVDGCEQSGRPFRTLPRLPDLVSGRVSLSDLKEVSIDDMLGREKVELDWNTIQRGLSRKTVMVSGGGGSIGSELCRQIARLGPDALIVFERSEYNLYRIEMELRQHNSGLCLHVVLGDVSDEIAVNHCLKTYRPDLIFHAAAYKHVPMLEHQGREAVYNNVIGTWRVANAAIRHGCQKFVLISTDKAVNPTSVMGASKRIAEVVCEALNDYGKTHFITVRFGNVLGSAGSVVPLFQEQIKAGGPVTVTHPDMTRYFMTIPEASQLILQAGAMGKGGEIFVLDMGEPIRITYLAEQMIRLSGRVPGKDIRIEFTGLRPGERLYEELFHEDEQLAKTSHEKILLARHRPVESGLVEQAVRDIEAACNEFDEEWVTSLIERLVPELRPVEQLPVNVSNVISLQKGAP